MNTSFLNDRRSMQLVSILIVTIIVIILAGYWLLKSQEAAYRTAQANNLQMIGKRNAVALEDWIAERKSDVQLLASNYLFFQQSGDYGQNSVTQSDEAYILNRISGYIVLKKYRDVMITDISGKVLLSATSNKSHMGAILLNDWKTAAKSDKVSMSEIKKCEIHPDDIVLDFYTPVYRQGHSKAEPFGFLVLRTSPEDYIYPMLSDLPIKSKTVESFLVEKQGDKVVFLNRLRNTPGAPFRFSLPLSTPLLPAAWAVNSKLSSYTGKDYSGEKVIAAFDAVAQTPWHLVTKINASEALRGFNFNRMLVLIVTLIMIALVLAILSNRATKQRLEIVTLNKESEIQRLAVSMETETNRLAVLKHFEYLFKHANDIILLTDLEGKILEANGKADNMYGYSYEELKTMDVFQLTAPQYRDESRNIFVNPAIAAGIVYESEHLKHNGNCFPVEISTVAITIDDKPYIQKIIRDISERKHNEQQLIGLNQELADKVIERTNEAIEAKSKLEGFFNVSVELLCITNAQGEFLELNPAWENILGYSKNELLSKKFLDFIHPDDIHATLEALKDLTEQSTIKHFTNRYRCKDGSYKYLKWNSASYGNLIYAAAHDVTESKNAEMKILALNTGLTNTNKELESFSYSISHDLRAPLRSLEGYSSALRDGYADKIDEQGIHYLDRISNAAIKMATLINDLLQISQLGQKQLTFRLINLSDIVSQVATELKEAFPDQHISIRISETGSVFADSDLMGIVFKNLLENARKFSSRKPISEIIFGSELESGRSVYYVRDNGTGFAMEYADKLFTPFQRYHHAEDFPGTGIGLSIVFRIITRHNGKIWVESSVLNGTTVYFTINTQGD